MLKDKKIIFFCSALVLPKVKFKILRFSEKFLLKKKINIITFGKSISRTSSDLSATLGPRLSTLKKIKSGTLLLDFIGRFLKSGFWSSFSQLDILDSNFGEFIRMRKKIYEIESNCGVNTTVLATNKVVNGIFGDFLFNCKKLNKSTYFFEKYFLKERNAGSVGLSKTLKYYLLGFFCFFIPDYFLLKKNILLSNAPWFSNFTTKTLTALDIFKGKGYFIFPSLETSFFVWLNFLHEIVKNLNVFEIIYFVDGHVFFRGAQGNFIFSNFLYKKLNIDLSLLNFFFSADGSFLSNSFFKTKNFLLKYEKGEFLLKNFIVNNLLIMDFVLIWANFFFMLKHLILKKFNLFIFVNLYSFFLFKKCQLLNNY